MVSQTHIINHYVPRFHLEKWKKQGAFVYDKNKMEKRKIEYEDFAIKRYYFINDSNELEIRIGKFESYIGNIIKKIDESDENAKLTGKELFLIKLYCLLCSYRHENTTEVIKSDEFGMYESNRYYFGAKNLKKHEDVLRETEKIISLSEEIRKDRKHKNFEIINGLERLKKYINNPIFANISMLHLSIIRNTDVKFITSNVFTIIENTLDNDHLFLYIPVTPTTALLLVKSEYYLTENHLIRERNRLNYAMGKTHPDPFLSTIFYKYDKDFKMHKEDQLLCSYFSAKSDEKRSEYIVKIHIVHQSIPMMLNSILYEDSGMIVALSDVQLEICRKYILLGPSNWRNIKI